MLSRRSGLGWAAAVAAAVLIAVVAISIQRRPTETVGGPIPDALRHAWQRPLPVAPGPDLLGSGFLSLTAGTVEFGREPGAAAARSAVMASGTDALAVTATVDTIGCAIGDVGSYRWSLEGKGTVMTLTAVDTDACAARQGSLVGPWVRSDLPPPADPAATLSPGTYQTSSFDPFGDPALSGQLSFTVPEGWKVKGDEPGSYALHYLADTAGSQPSTDALVMLLAQPRMAADLPDGSTCGFSDAPGVGPGVDDIVAAILARPGVISTSPAAVSIGGYQGKLLDLRLAPSWSRGCVDAGGPVVGIPILRQAGPNTGPGVGLGPDQPVRLILLKLTDERTMAIAIDCLGPSQASLFDQQVARLMPVIESFAFHPRTP
jgi:hypothetical protein